MITHDDFVSRVLVCSWDFAFPFLNFMLRRCFDLRMTSLNRSGFVVNSVRSDFRNRATWNDSRQANSATYVPSVQRHEAFVYVVVNRRLAVSKETNVQYVAGVLVVWYDRSRGVSVHAQYCRVTFGTFAGWR